MTLKEYADVHFGGNVAKFARAVGLSQPHLHSAIRGKRPLGRKAILKIYAYAKGEIELHSMMSEPRKARRRQLDKATAAQAS